MCTHGHIRISNERAPHAVGAGPHLSMVQSKARQRQSATEGQEDETGASEQNRNERAKERERASERASERERTRERGAERLSDYKREPVHVAATTDLQMYKSQLEFSNHVGAGAWCPAAKMGLLWAGGCEQICMCTFFNTQTKTVRDGTGVLKRGEREGGRQRGIQRGHRSLKRGRRNGREGDREREKEREGGRDGYSERG